MRYQILFSNYEVTSWVFRHLPRCSQDISLIRRDAFQSVGFTRHGKLTLGVVWYNFVKDITVECAIYSSSPTVTRRAILTVDYIPFDVFHVKHVTGFVRDDNDACIRLLKRAGWKLEGIQRKAFDGEHDCLVYGLTREDAERVEKILGGK